MFENKLTKILLIGTMAFSVGLISHFMSGGNSGGISESHLALSNSQATTLASFAEVTNPPVAPLPVVADATQPITEPSISISPDEVRTLEEILYIEGRSVPQGIVTVTLTKTGEKPVKFTVRADSSGEWVVAEKTYLSTGDWEVRARVQVKDQISNWSNPRVIRSIATGVDIFGLKVRYVVIAVILLIFFVVLGSVLAYFLHRIKILKRGLFEKQIHETQERFRQNFSEIRRDLTDELRILAENAKDRPLTPEEIQRREHVLRELDTVERETTEEMSEIEKKY